MASSQRDSNSDSSDDKHYTGSSSTTTLTAIPYRPPRRPLSPCSPATSFPPPCKRLRPARSQPQQHHSVREATFKTHTALDSPKARAAIPQLRSSAPPFACEELPPRQNPMSAHTLTTLNPSDTLPPRPALSLATSGLPTMSHNTSTYSTLAAPLATSSSSPATSSSSSPRKLALRPPPLLLPSSASALSSPSSLSLASPVSPSFSSRRQRNAKQLSLTVPSLESSSSHLAEANAKDSSSKRALLASSVPLSPNPSGNYDTLDLSETRSCPPTPRLILDTDAEDGVSLKPSETKELKSSLRGEISMRRRTSLPRLNILATGSAAHEALVPPTPSLARPKTGIPALTVESLVARNREAGAPLSDNPAEADEDFPYQFGPKEILPGLYLGSEQNAKDPMIIRRLGITQVICCAKEVACPWLADEAIQEEASEEHHSMEEESDDTTRADTSGDSHTTYLALPSSSMSGMATPTSRGSRSPSPSRPAFLRPAASTPNLKEASRSRSSSPLSHDLSNTMAREADGTEGPRSASMRVASQGHTGYMHRQFSANRRTGRPALSYTKLPWGHDEDDIAKHFEDYEICELIDRARRENGRCLVHCQLGVSRSATLMIGYCMRQAFRKEDLSALADIKSMHDSYTYVRAKSRWVAPNIGLLAQLVQYERALTAAISPGDSLPYNNSAYYDSQLSLPGHHGSRTPDNLSPSSTSGSEFDSRLTTPDTGADLVMPTNRQDKHSIHDTSQPLSTTTVIPKVVTNRVDDLSPMTASLLLTRSSRHPAETTPERTAFGSAQRKKEHRKTFSADFSKFPLGFTLHHEHSKT